VEEAFKREAGSQNEKTARVRSVGRSENEGLFLLAEEGRESHVFVSLGCFWNTKQEK
jgi:hypothetical protein